MVVYPAFKMVNRRFDRLIRRIDSPNLRFGLLFGAFRNLNMPLSSAVKQWCGEAAAACVAEEKVKHDLQAVGEALRGLYPSVREVLAEPEVRACFARAYLAGGGKEGHVPASWARVLYHWAFPGSGRVDGHYYKLEAGGDIVIDHGRDKREESPLAAMSLPPYLKKIAFASPNMLATQTLQKAPLRAIVVASGGSGKTTYVVDLVKECLENGLIDTVFVLTGTTLDPWGPLEEYEGVTLRVFDGNLDEVNELVDAQREAVVSGGKPPKGSPWGYGHNKILFVLDDLGDTAGMKKGTMGALLDSFFMTLRSEWPARPTADAAGLPLLSHYRTHARTLQTSTSPPSSSTRAPTTS